MCAPIAAAFTLLLACSLSYSAAPNPYRSTVGNDCAIPFATPDEESTALLALEISPGKCLDKNIHQRLVQDTKSIKAANPQLREVHYRSKFDSRSLLVTMSSDTTASSALAGSLPKLNSLLDQLGGAHVSALSGTLLHIKFDRPQNIVSVSESFREIQGVLSVDVNPIIGSGPTLCAHISSNTFAYIFDMASGDCPSGCTIHHLFHFESNHPGEISSRGEWSSESRLPRPEWADRYLNGGQCN